MNSCKPLSAAAFVIVLLSGIVHGLWTDRWVSAESDAFIVGLEHIPMTIGPWEGKDIAMDPNQSDRFLGSSRRYVNRFDGSSVAVFLLGGPSGPVSVHTPELCYKGAGWELTGAPAKRSLHSGASMKRAEFWMGTFRKARLPVPAYLRVYWSWNAEGTWVAPKSPRLAFAHYPVLYKVYVTRQMPTPDKPGENDPCAEFIRLLLPELERALCPT